MKSAASTAEPAVGSLDQGAKIAQNCVRFAQLELILRPALAHCLVFDVRPPTKAVARRLRGSKNRTGNAVNNQGGTEMAVAFD